MTLPGLQSVRAPEVSQRETYTVIAALRLDGLGAPAVFDGPIDTPTFRAYVERVLVLASLRRNPDWALPRRLVVERCCGSLRDPRRSRQRARSPADPGVHAERY